MRIWLSVAAALVIIGCNGPGGVSANPSPSPRPSPSPSPIASPTPTPRPTPSPIPDPTPTVFVQFTQSDYGAIGVWTQAGAVCNAAGTRPDGSPISGIRNPQTANSQGQASWIYPQLTTPTGSGVHNVSCSWRGQSTSFSASFDVGS